MILFPRSEDDLPYNFVGGIGLQLKERFVVSASRCGFA